MPIPRRAVIDVGTNSVKLLVAEVEGPLVRPLWEEGNQSRLGEGFYESHRLQPAAIQRTGLAVVDFAAKARTYGVEYIRLIATSAARDAVNQRELVATLERASGLRVELVSGDQEAEMAYVGVTTDPVFAEQRLLILDVGGGSSEFTLGEGEHRIFQRSFRIGSVRWLEKIRPGNPPAAEELAWCRESLREFIRHSVSPALEPVLPSDGEATRLVGSGGTAAILACMELAIEDYDRSRIEAARLSCDAVSRWVERLWRVPLKERQRIPGLPPNRADVILTGAAIYEALMEQLGFAELRVSTRGMRFAAVMQPASEAVLAV